MSTHKLDKGDYWLSIKVDNDNGKHRWNLPYPCYVREITDLQLKQIMITMLGKGDNWITIKVDNGNHVR